MKTLDALFNLRTLDEMLDQILATSDGSRKDRYIKKPTQFDLCEWGNSAAGIDANMNMQLSVNGSST